MGKRIIYLFIIIAIIGLTIGCEGTVFEEIKQDLDGEKEINEDIYDTSLSAKDLTENQLERIITKLEDKWEEEVEKLNYPEETEAKPEGYDKVIDATYSENEKKIAFALAGPYTMATTSSATGVIDMTRDEIIITNVAMGEAGVSDAITWHYDNNHFAYTLTSASEEGELFIDSYSKGKNIEEIDNESIGHSELTNFRNLSWDDKKEQLSFTSYSAGAKEVQEAKWIYDLDEGLLDFKGEEIEDTNDFEPSTLDVIMEDPGFSVFAEAVQKFELSEKIEKDRSTVFVPTNEAFEELKELLEFSSKEELLAQENLPEAISNHIVPEKLLLEDIEEDLEFETLAGDNITISTEDGSDFKLTYAQYEININKADIKTSNGVIHIVEDVLVPSRFD
ncbi:fasciclin domain-containing protein [Natranaerofaba carboxydovora]|uniref:fasciclin domain-containing protein n=1 Tax=Natranaerofaba carboxydovora TaxID=2742683 RepID=UPI001F1382BC|nr:fasciclin domain-containing protein [Natranaerofaba carboxydovora]UMZ74370.1 Fasciclin domain protein [Natranaerofaba carboxydovora]